jgi:type II secretory pathway component PulC
LNLVVFSPLIKQKKLPPLIIGILALGYLLAVILPLLTHVKISADPANTPLVHLSSDTETAPKQQDATQITTWHLFGLPPDQSATASGEPIATELELVLQGVFFLAQHPKMAHAIIESADQIQKTYKINDELPGGAILQAIERNKIILLRDNQQEYLELATEKAESAELDSLPDASAE